MKIFSPNYADSAIDLPSGTYDALVSSYSEMTSKKGAPMIAWDLNLINSEDFEGCPLRYFTVVSGIGSNRLRDFLLAVDSSYNLGGFCAEDYLNKKVTISVAQGGTYNGVTSQYPRITTVTRFLNHTNQ